MRENIKAALASENSFDDFCTRNGFIYRTIISTNDFVERRELQLAMVRAGARDGVDVVYRSQRDSNKKYQMTIAFKDKTKAALFRMAA